MSTAKSKNCGTNFAGARPEPKHGTRPNAPLPAPMLYGKSPAARLGNTAGLSGPPLDQGETLNMVQENVARQKRARPSPVSPFPAIAAQQIPLRERTTRGASGERSFGNRVWFNSLFLRVAAGASEG